MACEGGPGLVRTVLVWWRESAARSGQFSTTKQFGQRLCDFARESMPDRRRRRYGDLDYDWEYRVNTTGATVGWRDRLLGAFLSTYQPTEPGLFYEMLSSLRIDYPAFTFLDLGSGKGRALLMAADYPFKKIVGVEVLPSLHQTALENIRHYKSPSRRCQFIVSVCGDARYFELPAEPTVLYLFNPLPEAALREVVERLENSLRFHPRPLWVLYHNPLHEDLVARADILEKVAGTHQYAVYRSRL
ncbi:MAG TPA: class I SAM-dependent methyltransferase [Terriglobales bacterium]|nr:class I SAM-dependent methyltransferase [Terriglobales bacterium]